MNDADNRPAVVGQVEPTVMQHTPGPWHWKDGEEEDMPELVAPTGRVCWFGNDTQYYPTAGEPPSEADCRLIAAAPDLLQALRDLVDVMTGRMEGETVALHNALAALMKADGAA
jgi:hypothetical protein